MRVIQQVRQAIKSELGYNSRQVSVRDNPGGLSTSITVRLKKPGLDFDKIEAIAERHVKVDRCERSGEIMGGGNTYVFVERYRAPAA